MAGIKFIAIKCRCHVALKNFPCKFSSACNICNFCYCYVLRIAPNNTEINNESRNTRKSKSDTLSHLLDLPPLGGPDATGHVGSEDDSKWPRATEPDLVTAQHGQQSAQEQQKHA